MYTIYTCSNMWLEGSALLRLNPQKYTQYVEHKNIVCYNVKT